jgi:hypothetical protein
MGASQHLVQCAISVIRPSSNVHDAYPNLGILENRSEELLARLQGFLLTRPFRYVFRRATTQCGFPAASLSN